MTSKPPALDQLHAEIPPEHHIVALWIKITEVRFVTTSEPNFNFSFASCHPPQKIITTTNDSISMTTTKE